ncbi:hypothetical protein PVL29_022224 [Vitis rotundifolia]|uniref:Uncharacterized protein n=1 Tax=Vitis rotundifolia TaxID=103349 RepID=A0AA38YV60_VITRO|nr:hypothetical protein PVL29_022224 [Vitis rotundifolia]
MLCNSVGFNWLACPAATELEMCSGGQKGEGFPSSEGRGARGVGVPAGSRVFPAGTTTVGVKKKKKLNRTVPFEPSGSSDSPVEHRFSRSNSGPTTFRSN